LPTAPNITRQEALAGIAAARIAIAKFSKTPLPDQRAFAGLVWFKDRKFA